MSKSITFAILLAFAAPALAHNEQEAREAIATFKKDYASKDESARAAAVDALSATKHKLVVDALAGPVEKDAAPSVRRAAAKALGGQWSPTAVAALGKALAREASNDVASEIVRALGETRAEAAIPFLVPLLVPKPRGAKEGGDDPAALTGAALDALAKIGSPAAIEDVLGFLNKDAALHAKRRGPPTPSALGDKAEAALAAITGESHTSAAAWRRWWTEKKDTLKPIPVHRCDETGELFDQPTPETKCPSDPNHSRCGTFVRTRLEGGREPGESKKKGK